MGKYILSKYNFFKIVNDTVACVNLINKMLFAIDILQYEKLKKYEICLDQLENDEPVFFSALRKLGVIQDQNTDQGYSKELLLQNRVISFVDKSYRLTINPTLNCNFSCWYCYETHTKHRMSDKTIEATIRYIEKLIHIEKINHLNLDWFGGEPLLAYNTVMRRLALKAKELCDTNNVSFQSDITTNGYLIKPEMVPFFREINMRAFQITLDGDKETHDTIRISNSRESSYDKIVENISLLARDLKPMSLALRINFTRETFHKIHKIIESFPKELRPNITILLQQVWQDKDVDKVSIAESEAARLCFEQAGFKVDKDILNLKRYACYADLYHQAVINYDGRVFKCTARNFEKEKEDGILSDNGDIIWSNSFSKKITCATFENQKCIDCQYLPVCFGPCSQKVSIVEKPEDFNKYCYEMGIKATLDYMMVEFAKSGKALAPLLDYR